MITETIEWYTPAEKLPDDTRNVCIVIVVFGHNEIVNAYYDDGIWYTDIYEYEYAKDRPLFWCNRLKGPTT